MPVQYKRLWEIDGWQAYECDGHDPSDIYSALKKAYEDDGPSVVFCNTVMGKGVSFMEGIPDYHGKALNKEQYLRAMEELGGSIDFGRGLKGAKRPCRKVEGFLLVLLPYKQDIRLLIPGRPRRITGVPLERLWRILANLITKRVLLRHQYLSSTATWPHL